jgi:hypothetical protein
MDSRLIENYFPFYFAFSILWNVGLLIASIVHRRAQGLPILFWTVPNADFVENGASGHSHRTWYTKLGGANRCLVVAVDRGRLIIRPQFPFNLMFLPLVFGLEHDVPVDRVSSVVIKPGRLGNRLEVQFRDTNGADEQVTLYLRRPDDFLSALTRYAPSMPIERPCAVPSSRW